MRLRPDDFQALDAYGTALGKAEKFDEAGASFRKSLAIVPNISRDVHEHLAALLTQIGRTDEAIDELCATVRLRPENPVVSRELGPAAIGAPTDWMRPKRNCAKQCDSIAAGGRPQLAGVVFAKRGDLRSAIREFTKPAA